jgi:acetate kinase
MGDGAILAVNGGSTSLKLAVVDVADDGSTAVRWNEHLTISGVDEGRLALADALERSEAAASVSAVGHRIVHGGPRHDRPVVLDDALLDELADLTPLAPLHQPAGLALVAAARQALPRVPHVGCFDTAFHRTLGAAASTLALPTEARQAGLRRYGFHGLAYQSVVDQVGAGSLGRAALAHLGGGASVCAVVDGGSVDTSMGFTPTGGLVMSTRSGDLDPGALLFLLRAHADLSVGAAADALETALNHESGLKGVSGTTGDLQALLADRDAGDADAALAVEVFCRSVRAHVAAAAAELDGLDTIVFSGGIGEHAPAIRREVCASLGFVGVEIDGAANDASAPVISAADSRVAVRVVAVDEERVIARQTRAVLARS